MCTNIDWERDRIRVPCRAGPNTSGRGQQVKPTNDPDGIRTRVAALKGPCPRPLDDGANLINATNAERLGRWDNMRTIADKSSHHGMLDRMLHFFKFRQGLFPPQPAKEIYIKRGAGKGWPEECPPIRPANSFGFALLANFDVTFVRAIAGWRIAKEI